MGLDMLRGRSPETAVDVSKEAFAALSSTAWMVVETGKNGGDTATAMAMLQDAKAAYEEDDYPRTLELASKAQEAVRATAKVAQCAEKLRAAASSLELAKQIGIEVDSLEARLQRARDASKRGDAGAAVAAAQSVELEAGLVIRTSLNSLFRAIDWLLRTPSAAAESRRESLRQAREAAQHGRPAEAFETATRLLAEIAGLLEQPAPPATADPIGPAPPAPEPAPAPEPVPAPSPAPEEAFQALLAETAGRIETAHQFGLSLGTAEWLLADARVIREKDPARADALLRQAAIAATLTLEELAPRLRLTAPPVAGRAGLWIDVPIQVANTGRAVARDIQVRVLGPVEMKGRIEIRAIRAGDTATVRAPLRFAEAGKRAVTFEARWQHPLDGSQHHMEHALEADIQAGDALVGAADSVVCPACRGRLREGMAVSRCACRAAYHASCGSRTLVCFSCAEKFVPR
jgi:hypothetical protein